MIFLQETINVFWGSIKVICVLCDIIVKKITHSQFTKSPLKNMYKIYGIANCDTMKKAMTWLKENDIPFEFHNYKKDGLTKEKVEEWLTQKPWDVLVNRAGTTWKKLSDEEKATDAETATELMLKHTSIIKRPIIEADNIVAVGFKPDMYQEIFK